MAITKVQQATGNGATVALSGVAAGNLVVIQDSYFHAPQAGSAEGNPTDSNGTVSVGINPTPANVGSGLGDVGCGLWYVPNTASGTHTITPVSNTSRNLTVAEFSGCATSTPLDVTASAITTDSVITSQVTGTTATTAQADELVVIGLGNGAVTGAADVGFTDPVTGFTTMQKVSNTSTDMGTFHAFKVVSSTGTQSATYNWTDNEAHQGATAVIATFKAAVASDTLFGQAVL